MNIKVDDNGERIETMSNLQGRVVANKAIKPNMLPDEYEDHNTNYLEESKEKANFRKKRQERMSIQALQNKYYF